MFSTLNGLEAMQGWNTRYADIRLISLLGIKSARKVRIRCEIKIMIDSQ